MDVIQILPVTLYSKKKKKKQLEIQDDLCL